MPDNPLVLSAGVDTADQFMRELSSLGERFGTGYYPGGWLYRGHANAKWPLLPTTLRADVRQWLGRWPPGLSVTNLQQIAAEIRLIVEFFRVADLNGLTLPEDSQRFRAILESLRDLSEGSEFITGLRSGETLWPPDDLLSLFALAQHHGLPTRLLDWTTSGYIAAYFAAARASTWVKGPPSPRDATHLCVWAIAQAVLEVSRIVAPAGGGTRVRMVTAPAAGNVNLRAQKALFLVDRPPRLDPDAPVDTRPWNEALADMFLLSDDPVLTQVCLPVEEAPRLLRLLAFQGVDAATVFPGFDGVVKALDERRLWETVEEALERTLFD
jgi:hypothetical protein